MCYIGLFTKAYKKVSGEGQEIINWINRPKQVVKLLEWIIWGDNMNTPELILGIVVILTLGVLYGVLAIYFLKIIKDIIK